MQRSKELDILRALAVTLVLGAHMTVCPQTVSPIVHSLTVIWNRGGWTGVDLFFVLSGFLISGLLFKEFEERGSIAGWHFLIRRGFKIYPSFWLLILATIPMEIRRHNTGLGHKLVAELLFFQNYTPGLWGHTWSLAVEEHFYLALTLLFVLLAAVGPRSNRFRAIPTLFAVTAIACLTLRILTPATPFDGHRNLFPTHLRVDSLFFGVWLAYLSRRHRAGFHSFAQRYRMWLLSLGLFLFVPAFILPDESRFVHTLGLTMFYIGAGCLIVGTSGLKTQNRGPATWIAFIGSRSYSIYLWHFAVLSWALPILGVLVTKQVWYWPVYFVIYTLGSLCLGIVMAAIVEYPALRVRDRLFPSRTQGVMAPRAAANSLEAPLTQ